MSKKFKTIVIERPYDLYQESKEIREILARVWKLKLDGYKAYYPYGVMPISELDYFANHVIICQDIQGELIPLAASKSISTQACDELGIDFSIYEHVFKGCEDRCKDHVTATRNWVDSKCAKGEVVGYNASWTISPDIRDEPDLKAKAIELSQAMYYHYYTTQGIDHIITSASQTFKVDRLQKQMGFSYLEYNGDQLGTYDAHLYKDKPFFIMHLENNQFPKDFVEMSNKSKALWDDRTHYKMPTQRAQLKIAA